MTPDPSPSLLPAYPASVTSWWGWFLGLPLRVVAYLVGGLVVLVLLRHLITVVTNHLARTPTSTSDSELVAVLARANPLTTVRRAQRARTVGSVLRSTASLLVGTIVVLLVLDALGINLAPFIASAGIVGVAVGFGAQSLVKDFLAGLFMLAEDQYGVGDVVDLGPASGTVESVGLRVTTLRDDAGTLWFVPNGTITRVANKTQQWATATLEVDVDYFADPEQVRGVLVEAAARVVADAGLSGDVRGEPSVTGIEALTVDAMRFRVKVRTSPARQWEVARALRESVRAALVAAEVPLGGQRDLWDRAHPADPAC